MKKGFQKFSAIAVVALLMTFCSPEEKAEVIRGAGEEVSIFEIYARSLAELYDNYQGALAMVGELYSLASAGLNIPFCDNRLVFSRNDIKTFDNVIDELLKGRQNALEYTQAMRFTSSLFARTNEQFGPLDEAGKRSMVPQQETDITRYIIGGRESMVDLETTEQLFRPLEFFDAAYRFNLERTERAWSFLSAVSDPEVEEQFRISDEDHELIEAAIAEISDGEVTSIEDFLDHASINALTTITSTLNEIYLYRGVPGELYPWGESYSNFILKRLNSLFFAADNVVGSAYFAWLTSEGVESKYERLYPGTNTCPAIFGDYRTERVELNILGRLEINVPAPKFDLGITTPHGVLLPYSGGRYDDKRPIILLDATPISTGYLLYGDRIPLGGYRLLYSDGGMIPAIFEPIIMDKESNEFDKMVTLTRDMEPVRYSFRTLYTKMKGSQEMGDIAKIWTVMPPGMGNYFNSFWTHSAFDSAGLSYGSNQGSITFRPSMSGLFYIFGWFINDDGLSAYSSVMFESYYPKKFYGLPVEEYAGDYPPNLDGVWNFGFQRQVGAPGDIGKITKSRMSINQRGRSIYVSDEDTTFGRDYPGQVTGSGEYFTAVITIPTDLGSCQAKFKKTFSGFFTPDARRISGRVSRELVSMSEGCDSLSTVYEISSFCAVKAKYIKDVDNSFGCKFQQ